MEECSSLIAFKNSASPGGAVAADPCAGDRCWRVKWEMSLQKRRMTFGPESQDA